MGAPIPRGICQPIKPAGQGEHKSLCEEKHRGSQERSIMEQVLAPENLLAAESNRNRPVRDPYAGWCGTRELTTPGDPIRLIHHLMRMSSELFFGSGPSE